MPRDSMMLAPPTQLQYTPYHCVLCVYSREMGELPIKRQAPVGSDIQ
jgi:hypothetical protein